MKIDVTKKTFEVKTDGKIYNVKYATFKDLQEIEDKAKETKEEDQTGFMFDVLNSFGLPREVAEDIPVKYLKQIFQEIKSPN